MPLCQFKKKINSRSRVRFSSGPQYNLPFPADIPTNKRLSICNHKTCTNKRFSLSIIHMGILAKKQRIVFYFIMSNPAGNWETAHRDLKKETPAGHTQYYTVGMYIQLFLVFKDLSLPQSQNCSPVARPPSVKTRDEILHWAHGFKFLFLLIRIFLKIVFFVTILWILLDRNGQIENVNLTYSKITSR